MSEKIILEVSLTKNTLDEVKKNAKAKKVEVNDYIENIVEREVLYIRLPRNFTYHAKDKKLYNSSGEKIILTRKEEKVFELLINNVGKVVELEKLYLAIWGENDKKSALFSLRNFIKSIREKTAVELIKNVPGKGYQINKLI
ncbi:helix-turn-helix domain-containing protein [Aliarcobacter butzleri]|uniref:helix-turn-helix domain-containing protein n=1 Tax=Aliarcobacter butzleri TaxID=28197 RepID=UPI001269B305|nr:helix-turn-helix domain-containing protein [Aliarcobacter butzleri]